LKFFNLITIDLLLILPKIRLRQKADWQFLRLILREVEVAPHREQRKAL